jgi:MFS family permease
VERRTGIVIACTIGNLVSITPAVHAVFGLFLIPLSTEFGWPRAAISVVLGIIAVTGAVVLPLIGQVADRYGTRRILLIGNAALAVSIAALSLTTASLTVFYLLFFFVALAGTLASSPLLSKALSDWFDTNRGTVLGFSAGLGNGLGATVMPILAAVLIPIIGWRASYAAIGAAVFLIGFPTLFLFLRDAPRYRSGSFEDVPTPVIGLGLAEAVRTPAFWLLVVPIAAGAGGLTAIFSHIVPILVDRGISVATATAVLSVMALATAAWQIVAGALLDRSRSARIVAPMYCAAIGGVALLGTATGTLALVIGGILLGIGLGTQYGALPYLISRYFGLRSFGVIVGVMYSAVTLFQGFTPIALDHGFDIEGTYRTGMITIGACIAVGAMLLVVLPAYPKSNATYD